MHYDTLIIGAGLSGLAAGIRTAYYDQSVCVLERHTTIGGLNSFYRLRQRNYDVGLHAVTNCVPPGTRVGPLSKLLRQLRLRWDDFALAPQTESRIAFPGVSLKFTNDFACLQQQVAAAFPAQQDNFARLAERVRTYDDMTLNPAPVSARAVLRETISDPLLIEMLLCPLMFYGSATPQDMDFHQFVVMFKSIFFEGFGRPYEGVRRIMKTLVRQYKEVGGELRLRAGVRKILSEGSRVVGVELDNGEVLTAKNVVSSAGYVETMRLCSPAPPVTAERPSGEVTFVESISILDCQPFDLNNRQTIIFYNDSESFRYENPAEPLDLRSGIICSPNNFQYEQPLAEGCIRITALANNAYWFGLPDADYAAEKQAWAGRMIESALRFMPDFRTHVIDTDIFTPRTIERFTGHVRGCVYGAPDKHLTGQTQLENLFICGTDQGYLGIVGSMLSGITVANLHLLKSTGV